jgi:hypothetical protein
MEHRRVMVEPSETKEDHTNNLLGRLESMGYGVNEFIREPLYKILLVFLYDGYAAY